jgi:serine/threonine-protein kinase HipA
LPTELRDLLAVTAGLEMADVEVIELDGYAHLLIRRFDVVDGERLHQHTFGGLVHVDYNEPGASSYEEYFRAIQRLGMAYDALTEAFRRMAFNVLARNQDDHVKNLSFHMDRTGTWSLTPAYDVTFAVGRGWTRAHQMRLADKTSDIEIDDMLTVGRDFGVKRPERILDRIRETLTRWESFAHDRGVPEDARSRVRAAIDEGPG